MKFETKGFPRKILSVAKTTTIRKWELNACRNFVNLRTDDSFVDRCCRKIYTIESTIKIYNRIYTMNM